MARSNDGDGRSVLASCGESVACRVPAGACVLVSCTTVLVRESQKLAASSPVDRHSSDDMRDISRPSRYFQSLVRNVRKHNEALDDDKNATKDIPQDAKAEYAIRRVPEQPHQQVECIGDDSLAGEI